MHRSRSGSEHIGLIVVVVPVADVVVGAAMQAPHVALQLSRTKIFAHNEGMQMTRSGTVQLGFKALVVGF